MDTNRRSTENFDFSTVVMKPVTYSLAKEVIVKNHYSHCMPSCQIALGFYIENELNCVILYGQSATCKMAKSLPSSAYLELTRLFSFDWGPKNIESYCIGQSFRYIKQQFKNIEVLISFADPSEKHLGIIYQATNWLYCGKSCGDEWYVIEGKKLHPRSVVAKYGTRSEKKLKELGIAFQRSKLAGKHRYIKLLGASKKRNRELQKQLKYPVLPYPKNLIDERPNNGQRKSV